MLTFTSNIVATACIWGVLISRQVDLRNLWAQIRPISAVAMLTGLERALTNASLYSISASMKTMLHAFNVPFTVVASAVIGVDQATRDCLFGCQCSRQAHRSNSISLSCIFFGALLTAADSSEVKGSWIGIFVQLLSGCAFALKYSAAELIIKSKDTGTGTHNMSPAAPPVSKLEMAAVTFPTTALVGFVLLPIFDPQWKQPNLWDTIVTGVGIMGILLSELRLTELKGAITLSVLGNLRNVLMIAYFVVQEGEVATPYMLLGFTLSTVGSLAYTQRGARQRESKTDADYMHPSDAALEEVDSMIEPEILGEACSPMAKQASSGWGE